MQRGFSFFLWATLASSQLKGPMKWVDVPHTGSEFVTNEGYQLLKNLGSLYLVDLTGAATPFEDKFARKLTGSDKDTILVTVSGDDIDNEEIFAEMKKMVEKRYTSKMIKTDYLQAASVGGVKSSEAGIWFFLYGVASTSAGQTESIDALISKLLALAESSVTGKAFYPKQTVLDLMEGSLSKMHPELAPYMRKLGYITIEKGLRYQSHGLDLSSPDVFISAEYFQFWTELSVFVFNNMPKENILIQPMTIVSNKRVTITLSNINQPQGGPFLLPQFEALRGFLEAKSQQRLPANAQDSLIKADYLAFFSGFCKRQSLQPSSTSRVSSHRLFIGKRHINAPIRAQEFRFLVEAFRSLQTSVTDLAAKFTKAADVLALIKPWHDTFAEYDAFDLISEVYIAPEEALAGVGGEGGVGAGEQQRIGVDAFIDDVTDEDVV